jgi:polysaccharide chain length determinant protein (PEP-CTERM system associated)
MINPGKPFNIYDYFEIFLLRIWFFIIPLAVVMAGTGLYVLLAPKQYRATTLILVTPQKVPEAFVRPTVTAKVEERLQSIGQEIMSRTRLEQVITEFNLYRQEANSLHREEIVELMQKNIQVQIKGKEGYFTISYTGEDPRTVTLVANKLASLFIEENLRLREQQAQGTTEFLSIELKATKAKLEEQEGILSAYKRKYLGELPEQRDSNLRVLSGLQTQYQKIADSMRLAQERKLMLEKQVAEVEALIAWENKPLEEVRVEEEPLPEKKNPRELKIAQLKNLLEDLRMKYTEKHPDILIIKKKINDLESEAEQAKFEEMMPEAPRAVFPSRTKITRAEVAKGRKKKEIVGVKDLEIDPRLKEVKGRLLATEKEIEHLREEDAKVKTLIAKYQERVDKSFEREQDMYNLTRDYNNTREAYNSLLTKSQEAQQAENLERRQKGEQFKVIDPARIPEKPYKPDIARVPGICCRRGRSFLPGTGGPFFPGCRGSAGNLWIQGFGEYPPDWG